MELRGVPWKTNNFKGLEMAVKKGRGLILLWVVPEEKFYIYTRKDQQAFKSDTANSLQHMFVFMLGSQSACLRKEEASEVSKGPWNPNF